MKRIWSLLLAAVLLCALCAPAMAQEEKITLEFWEMSYGNDDRYTETCEKLIAQYEAENPNVTINMTYQPWDNYYQLFLTAVSSGAAPDVASCAIDQPDLFAQMNEIQYLDSVIDEWKEEGIYSDYSEDMLNFFKYEGNQIAIPYMVGYRGFFYRTDYLEQAGVEDAAFDSRELCRLWPRAWWALSAGRPIPCSSAAWRCSSSAASAPRSTITPKWPKTAMCWPASKVLPAARFLP